MNATFYAVVISLCAGMFVGGLFTASLHRRWRPSGWIVAWIAGGIALACYVVQAKWGWAALWVVNLTLVTASARMRRWVDGQQDARREAGR